MSENKIHGFKPQESGGESDKTKHDSSTKAAHENSGTNEPRAKGYQDNFSSFGEGMPSVDAFGIDYGGHVETANKNKNGSDGSPQSNDFFGQVLKSLNIFTHSDNTQLAERKAPSAEECNMQLKVPLSTVGIKIMTGVRSKKKSRCKFRM